MSLRATDFPAYFAAVHDGKRPFLWQQRLLDEVLESGWESRVLALPTGTGKTSVLDVALFALALQAHLPPAERRAPRRTVLVVDRRVVVDEAHRRALRIARALDDPQDDCLARVRAALLGLGGERAVEAALLRGGIYREDRWARTPMQPILMSSTVDQVGSRLLHRGYGVSNWMWPVHAGLLSHDCLVVLDEAHCSRPFQQTLETIARYRGSAEDVVPGPFAAVTMTATPQTGPSPFVLLPAERTEPSVAARLKSAKIATLEVVEDGDDAFAAACVRHVLGQGEVSPLAAAGTTTLVVCNRVATARAVHTALAGHRQPSKAGAPSTSVDALLLTGRARPVERDRLLDDWKSRLLAGRSRVAVGGARPLVVVATQCIEVGADLDADALVTEACPLDSLRQRLGRVDRLGEVGRAHVVVLCRRRSVGDSGCSAPDDDPIYGTSISRTWWWLLEKRGDQPTIDVGTDAIDRRLPVDPVERAQLLAALSAPAPDAPSIPPSYLDLWVQTGPAPGASPDPAVFLHGPLRSAPEVLVVWRGDMDSRAPETWVDVVAELPPTSAEAACIPLREARSWLSADPVDQGADLESETVVAQKREASRDEGGGHESGRKQALRWRGLEGSELASGPDALRPGDVLVVPCAYGGCDRFGWNPGSGDPVLDVAEEARLAARRTPVLRLHPELCTPTRWGERLGGLGTWARCSRDAEAGLPSESELRDLLRPLLLAVPGPGLAPGLSATVKTLAADSFLRVSEHPSGVGLVLSGRDRLSREGADFTDEDQTSSLAVRGAVRLDRHLGDAEAQARRTAKSLKLPDHLGEALALAAALHDLGKADPRFQAWLAGGDRLRVARGPLLAKSERVPASPVASELARQRACYPKGGRHELLSVRLAEAAEVLPQETLLADLVLHLVASHHGRCRPFAPVVEDERPVLLRVSVRGREAKASSATGLERLDSGVAERFWRLIRHHGWWGLSFLEACLRLADHRASEAPSSDGEPS